MSRFCGTCGAPLDALALSGGRCLVCGTPIADPRDVIAEANTLPGGQPARLPPAPARQSAAWPKPRDRVARETPGWLRSARAIALFLLFALLVAALLAVLVQHIGFQLILAPSASSSSSSSSNSSSSSQSNSGAAATATVARGGAPTPTAGPSGGTPTPAISPTPGASPTPGPSPTATPVPATLNVDPSVIKLTVCLGTPTQFTISNTGGVSFSWIAAANGTGYTLAPTSGTLDGEKQQVVKVSGILASGNITVTAQSARNSPQQVSIQCQL